MTKMHDFALCLSMFLETFGAAHLTQSCIMLLTTPTILTFIQVVSIFKVAQFKNN